MRVIISLITVLSLCLQAPASGEPGPDARHMRIGTTFSQRQSLYLEQDWEKAYLVVLDVGFDMVRLGAYWDEIEKREGEYDFSVLDWQVNEARKRGIPVLLTVGMKAPRWPEFFIPEWVKARAKIRFGTDVSKDAFLRDKTLKFIRETVLHFNGNEGVGYWQAENEPLDRSGPDMLWIGPDFLKQEAELIRSLDTGKRPVVVNIATYPNKFLYFMSRLGSGTSPLQDALSICDILGVNIYPVVGHKLWWIKLYFWTHSHEREELFSHVMTEAGRWGKDVWVTELQAEPWEPGELVHKGEGTPITASPDMTETALDELDASGINTVLLWGCEYWIYRVARYKDKGWWLKFFDILREKNNKMTNVTVKERREKR
ncbi:MAG: beta-galactosidase [Candidatus Omnitrophota bacterium]